MSAYPPQTGKRGPNLWAIALTVTMATFMEVLDTSIANVSLPHIAGNLSASQDESTWILTSYLVSNAIILPISGWLASRFGRKRFYMSCVFLFTLSSFLCGLAPNLGVLIFFRILQGLGGGGLAPSEQSILADTFPQQKRGMAFAIYGMAVVLAPAIGPTLGGYITDHYSWRWIFYINIPVGILSLLLTSRLIHDPPYLKEQRKTKAPIDFTGLILITVGLGCLQVMLDKGQEADWFSSPFICTFAVIAGCALTVFIFWEWFQAHPVVDLRLFKNINFAAANLLMFMLGFILFSTTVLLPQFLQVLLGYTAQLSGMVLSPGAVLIIFIMPLVGWLVTRCDPRYLVAFGFACLAFAMYHMTNINLGIDFDTAMMWRIYQSVGLAFLFVPINMNAYNDISPEKSNEVSSIMNLSRNIGGSAGISLVTTMIARRSQYHQSILTSHAASGDLLFRQRLQDLTQTLHHSGLSRHEAMQQAYGRIYAMIQAQAATLSYQDVFWVLSIASFCMLPLVFLMGKPKPGQALAARH